MPVGLARGIEVFRLSLDDFTPDHALRSTRLWIGCGLCVFPHCERYASSRDFSIALRFASAFALRWLRVDMVCLR
jgi:hypothetical protein